jgi:hypothetical protein
LNQTDTARSAITEPLESNLQFTKGNTVEQVPKPEPELGFLSWDDGFFQFPGCDAEVREHESQPLISDSEASTKHSGEQDQWAQNALSGSRNHVSEFDK